MNDIDASPSDEGGDPPCWAHLYDTAAPDSLVDDAALARLGALHIHTDHRCLRVEQGESGATVLKKAKAAGIKTIDYDRLTLGGGADVYVSFNNVKVGELQGDGLIKCITDKGVKNQSNAMPISAIPVAYRSTGFRMRTLQDCARSSKPDGYHPEDRAIQTLPAPDQTP